MHVPIFKSNLTTGLCYGRTYGRRFVTQALAQRAVVVAGTRISLGQLPEGTTTFIMVCASAKSKGRNKSARKRNASQRCSTLPHREAATRGRTPSILGDYISLPLIQKLLLVPPVRNRYLLDALYQYWSILKRQDLICAVHLFLHFFSLNSPPPPTHT